MKRRQWLFAGLGVSVVGGTAVYFATRRNDGSGSGVDEEPVDEAEDGELAKKLRARLPMLVLTPGVLNRFARDYERVHTRQKGKRASNALVQQFLFSTDFFPEADESKAPTYVGYYDPELSPCVNPFRGT